MGKKKDELDELIVERTKVNPSFPLMIEEALRIREAVRDMASRREQLGLSQTVVAARMGTSQAAVNRIERGDSDIKLSTLAKYVAATDGHLQIAVVDGQRATA